MIPTEEYLEDMVNSVYVPNEPSCFTTKSILTMEALSNVIEHLQIADQVPKSILIDIVFVYSEEIVVTSYMKRQLEFVIESLDYLSNKWDGQKGDTHIRYLHGVSGMGKSVTLKLCANYIKSRSVFLMYIPLPMALIQEDQEEADKATRELLMFMYEKNSVEVVKEYLCEGGELSRDTIYNLVQACKKT